MEPATPSSKNPNPPPSPTPEEIRAKNIAAVKDLLTEAEWAEVAEAIYAERSAADPATVEALAASEEVNRKLKLSVGRLYGHFNNVMLKWGIVAMNSYNKEARADIPFESSSLPLPAAKGRPLYVFDQSLQELVPVVPPSNEKKKATPPAPPPEKKPPLSVPLPASLKRRRTPTKFSRKDAPAKEELIWRREITEKQLKSRPSSLSDVMKRLATDGFPVTFPYYAEKVREKSSRLYTLVAADLYLLVYNGAVKRKANLYSWVADRPDRYKSRPKPHYEK